MTSFILREIAFAMDMIVYSKNVHPHGTIKIENPKTCYVFKMNGKCLKHFLETPMLTEEGHDLVEPPPSS